MFRFKQFNVDDTHCAQKVGTDSVLLGSWASAPDSANASLDLGCGSGLLALMLAQRFPAMRVTGVEIDEDACADARANFVASSWSGRLDVVCADVFAFAADDANAHAYDLIISNPPYFKNSLLPPDAARSTARHGFAPEALPTLAAGLLRPGGRLAMVTPADCEAEVIFNAAIAGLRLRRLCRVRTKPGKPAKRLLWEFETKGAEANTQGCLTSELAVDSDECRCMTGAFYL